MNENIKEPAAQNDPDCHYSSYSGPRRLLHWGPLIAISIVLWIASFTIYCDLMYWPLHKNGGAINLSVFTTWVVLVFYHHYQASAIGPGFVTLQWQPKPQHRGKLQYCETCQGFKPPRSHHCRKCGRCVMKMDHHCPWINTCCGHMNHANFVYFLFFAPIGCIHGFFILVMSLYYGINLRWYMMYGTGDEPRVVFSFVTLVGTMFAVGLAFGVTIAVGLLFILQMKSIISNKTGIEEWIEKKAENRDLEPDEPDFDFPYDLGCRANLRQVLFTRDGWPKSDGYWWDVKEGCGQFDLSVEQLKQKANKRERAIDYTIVRSYSGSWFPLSLGCCVCCCFPWSDEPRIPIQPSDNISVTRWRKHWLYGEKRTSGSSVLASGDCSRPKGWFPRKCAVESNAPNHVHLGHSDGEKHKHE